MEKVKISPDLVLAFEKGKSSDLQFSKIPMKLHYESKERKVGHKPISICSVPIPADLKIAYVEAWNNHKHYYYVVDQLLCQEGVSPQETIVHDGPSAVRIVFKKLKEFALQ